MRMQSVSHLAVRPPSTRPASQSSPSKPFSAHVGRKTKTANGGQAASVSGSSGNTTPGAGTVASSASPTATSASNSASSSASTGSSADTSSIQSSLDQSEDQNMQFLQIQSQVNDQSETFTTLSNVMKTENDTLKNTAANMAI